MAAGLRTVTYAEPGSGVATVFYDDGTGNLTQAVYLCDPSAPGTPLPVTLVDLQETLKTTNKLLFLLLQKLERK